MPLVGSYADTPPSRIPRDPLDILPEHAWLEERTVDYRLQIFDTCEEVRRKIKQFFHMYDKKTTKAAFMRTLSIIYHETLAVGRLKTFMDPKKTEALDGNTSPVYYAAFVFFELCRLRDGRPKSDHRVNMEEIWGDEGGVPTQEAIRADEEYWTFGGIDDEWYMDEYGKMQSLRQERLWMEKEIRRSMASVRGEALPKEQPQRSNRGSSRVQKKRKAGSSTTAAVKSAAASVATSAPSPIASNEHTGASSVAGPPGAYTEPVLTPAATTSPPLEHADRQAMRDADNKRILDQLKAGTISHAEARRRLGIPPDPLDVESAMHMIDNERDLDIFDTCNESARQDSPLPG